MPLWELKEPVHIGKILKSHSYLGAVKVAFFMPGLDERLREGEYLYLEWNKKPVPYLIEEINWLDDKTALILFADVDCDEEADKLRDRNLWLGAEEVGELEEEEAEEDRLIGYAVQDEAGNDLGRVQDIFENGPQLLLQVIHKGREYFIPLHPDLVKKVLPRKKIIKVDLPEGLMEL